MNRYHLLHVTEFVYDGPVSESYNEVRLRPMHDETQSCLSFRLTTTPASPAFSYRDSLGNWVHQVNILPEHTRLRVQAESVVLAHEVPAITSWLALGELEERNEELVEEFFDMLAPSKYVPHLAALEALINEVEARCDGTVTGFAGSDGALSMIFCCRFAASGRRGLPGFCSSTAGGVAQARHPGAICLRVPGPAE